MVSASENYEQTAASHTSSNWSQGYPVGPWKQAAAASGLLSDGVPTATIFEQMTTTAQKTNAVNLGQGFPDQDGPDWVLKTAAEKILGSSSPAANQYAPGTGLVELREAVSRFRQRHYGQEYDPASQVLITTGATEAIAASILALVSPGDEVLTFEPFYDSYAAMIALAGATQTFVPLPAPSFVPSVADVEAALTERTRMVIINTPHNPTGVVWDRDTLAAITEVCARHGVWVLTDEVYEQLVYEGSHVPVASAASRPENVITISSAGKTYSLTGWKIGWVLASAEVIAAVRSVKQFLTYSSGPAYQHAIAQALDEGDGFLVEQQDNFRARRDQLAQGLQGAGLSPAPAQGGYFLVVDLKPWSITDAKSEALNLIEQTGVVGIPVSALCRDDTQSEVSSWMRYAFCKTQETIDDASRRLQRAYADGLTAK